MGCPSGIMRTIVLDQDVDHLVLTNKQKLATARRLSILLLSFSYSVVSTFYKEKKLNHVFTALRLLLGLIFSEF